MRRNLKRIALVLVVVVGMTACLYALWPHERLLLEHARRVDQGAWFAKCWDYQWLSSHELLLIYPTTNTSYRFVRHDLLTEQRSELKPFEEIPNPLQEDIQVSPDGKWLLWTVHEYDVVTHEAGHELAVSSKEGVVRFSEEQDNSLLAVCWLADSQHWLEFHASKTSGGKCTHIVRRCMDAPNEVQPLAMPTSPFEVKKVTALPHDHILVQDTIFFGECVLTVKDIGLDAKGQSTVLATRRLQVSSLSSPVAPQGDRLAVFERVSRQPSPMMRWFYRLLRQDGKTQAKDYWTLSVSRLNGSEHREIGSIEIKGTLFARDSLPCLVWLPDGKSVSFSYDKHLYVIPVD